MLHDQENFFVKNKYSRIASFVLGIFIFIYLFLIFRPWRFFMPEMSIDGSWVAVITYGATNDWQWGKDIVFNYGPYGFVWHHIFDADLITSTIMIRSLLLGALAWGIAYLLFALPPLIACFIYILMITGFILSRDGFFFMFPLLIALGYFRLPIPASTWALLPLAAASGIIGMIKLSYGMASLMILGIVDLHRLLNRRWPVYTPAMLLAFFASYLLAGQHFTEFPKFLSLSLEIISGYSAAMMVAGPWWELVTFIGLSILLLFILIGNEWWNNRLQTPSLRARAVALLLVLSIFWLLNFKQGFVRHDLHSLLAWGGLAAAAAMAAATIFWQPPARLTYGVTFSVLVIAVSAAFLGLWRWQAEGGPPVNALVQMVFYGQPLHEWKNLQRWFSTPEQYLAGLEQQRKATLQDIRNQQPLPPLQGTVDVIPSIQSVILAHGYDYQPRPIFQEYAAYTPRLIEANRAFLRSDRAPDYLFFSPGSIDNRYPTSAEGASWPDILRFYKMERTVGNLALLARRTQPLEELLNGNSTRMLQFGQSLNLTDEMTTFARIRIKPTILGRLANLLFKPAPVFIKVKLHNGIVKTHTLIPDMVSEGFFLSPYIENSTEFGWLMDGMAEKLFDNKVSEIIMETSQFGRFYYQEPLSLDMQFLKIDNLSNH